jgi:predicted dehydrogenase
MLAEKPGNVVVLAGNNSRKTEYILKSIEAGLNVLADKPMAIVPSDLDNLRKAFAAAEANKVLLYDIMTERHEITTILQREFSQLPDVFGELKNGTPDDPSITKESVHHFAKTVAGAPLKRPQWFFDVRQEGEGIVDVTTHLVDLVQWEAFPEQTLAPEDSTVLSARRWPTPLSPVQFKQVTGSESFPDYLAEDVKDGVLQVYANGDFTYRLRNVHAKVSVIWNFEAPPGTGDTHYSIMRGTKSNLVIRQGKEQGFKPVLYIEPADQTDPDALESAVDAEIGELHDYFPEIKAIREDRHMVISIPEKYSVGHEAHFGQVTEDFLYHLQRGRLPDWEVPNMLTKYDTIMQAYSLSQKG